MSLLGGAELLCVMGLMVLILDPQDIPKVFHALGQSSMRMRQIFTDLMTLKEGGEIPPSSTDTPPSPSEPS